MIDALFGFAMSNLIFSLLLALVALGVQVFCDRPRLSHALWLLVLLKAIAPPLVALPLLGGSPQPAPNGSAPPTVEFFSPVDLALPATTYEPTTFEVAVSEVGTTSPELAHSDDAALSASRFDLAKPALATVWLGGALLLFVSSMLRLRRFNSLLRREASPAVEFDDLAQSCAQRFGLTKAPLLLRVPGKLSPMVWWTGGRPRVVIPADLEKAIGPDKMRCVLAHEFAHIARGDHLVRWLEWTARVAFWWNPVVWLAARQLRVNEELCCDALVLSTLRPAADDYADSLLSAFEFLAAIKSTHPRTPAFASEMSSGGQLQRRFKMIVTHTSWNTKGSRGLRAVALIGALLVLPLGLTQAGNDGSGSVGAGSDGAGNKDVAENLREQKDINQPTVTEKTDKKGADKTKSASQPEVDKMLSDISQANKSIAEFEKVKTLLKNAVETGLITPEEAETKREAAINEIFSSQPQLKKEIREHEKLAQSIEERVKAGAISRKEADKTLAKDVFRITLDKASRAEYDRIAAARLRLQKELEKGIINREEFEKAQQEARESLARNEAERQKILMELNSTGASDSHKIIVKRMENELAQRSKAEKKAAQDHKTLQLQEQEVQRELARRDAKLRAQVQEMMETGDATRAEAEDDVNEEKESTMAEAKSPDDDAIMIISKDAEQLLKISGENVKMTLDPENKEVRLEPKTSDLDENVMDLIQQRLFSAVDEGLISLDEAQRAYAALDRDSAERRAAEARAAAVEQKIREAIEAGILSKIEADAMLAAYRQRRGNPVSTITPDGWIIYNNAKSKKSTIPAGSVFTQSFLVDQEAKIGDAVIRVQRINANDEEDENDDSVVLFVRTPTDTRDLTIEAYRAEIVGDYEITVLNVRPAKTPGKGATDLLVRYTPGR